MKRLKKLVFTLLLVLPVMLSASEINSQDVPAGTYVIGKYMFTRGETTEEYDGKLTAKHIMLAAKSIEGDTLDDMVIYYKMGNGSWINSLSGNTETVPEKIEIINKNMETYKVPKATIKKVYINPEVNPNNENEEIYDSFRARVYLKELDSNDNSNMISGWDLYMETTSNVYDIIVNGKKYVSVEDITFSDSLDNKLIILGENYVFPRTKLIARYYYLDKGNKVYGDYSEIVDTYTGSLKISKDGNTLNLHLENDGENILRYYISKEYNSSVEKIKDISIRYITALDEEIDISTDNAGTKYRLHYENDIVSFNFDNKKIFIQDYNKPATPTIRSTFENYSDGTYNYGLFANENVYLSNCENINECENPNYTISGFELYEKVNDEYVKVEVEPYGIGQNAQIVNAFIRLNPGEVKTYAIRVYALDSNNEKVYSDYSNEIELDGRITTPTIRSTFENYSDGTYNYGLFANENVYLSNCENINECENPNYTISGFELYEKVNVEYVKVEVEPYGIGQNAQIVNAFIRLNPGEVKTYTIRVYALDSNNEKVYSDYSNEIVIDTKSAMNN